MLFYSKKKFKKMILAIDVYYLDDEAKTIGILFEKFIDSIKEIKFVITDYQRMLHHINQVNSINVNYLVY